MKQYLNKKQIAVWILVFVVIVLICAFIMSFSAPTIAYAKEIETAEIFYAATGSVIKETESFEYASKTVEAYSINSSFPDYYNNSSLLNTCSNVAGANIVGYYDRYFDNLIQDCVVGIERNDKYTYLPMKNNMTKLQAVINDLYQRMQTNVNGNGNTQAQYKNGLSSYVQSKGLTTSYISVMTNAQFDLEKAKAQLQNGNPISLYMSGYNFTNVKDNGSSVTLVKGIYDGNHIAIAYGYEKVSYFDVNGNISRTEIYLKVSTGLDGVTGVYVVNNCGILNDAEAVHIA